MKKILIISIIGLILLTGLVLASPPMPFILGHEIIIDGELAKNTNVSLQNSRTLETLETKTNEKGKYLIDLANFKNGYYIGDIINLTIFWKGKYKSYPITIEGEGGKFEKLGINWEKSYSVKEEGCLDTFTFLEQLEKLRTDMKKESRIFLIISCLFTFIITFIITFIFTKKYSK